MTNLDPVLHSNESFIKNIRDQAMVNGLFYGFMIIMFFYNLALFVQLKEIVYFYFLPSLLLILFPVVFTQFKFIFVIVSVLPINV